jgi:putative intracellular protease/amidase
MELTGHTAERKPVGRLHGAAHAGRRVAVTIAVAAIGDVPVADVVVVPGSDRLFEPLPEFVEWLRRVHPTTSWTVSVGTGSSHLAAAGVLAVVKRRRTGRHRRS